MDERFRRQGSWTCGLLAASAGVLFAIVATYRAERAALPAPVREDAYAQEQMRREQHFAKVDERVSADVGVVIFADRGRGEVTISVGHQGAVRPGMTFEVFKSAPGLQGVGQGVAELEVVEVRGGQAVCRVVRSSQAGIEAGEFVWNDAIFGQQVPWHFAVGGSFDLDGDGVWTVKEGEQLMKILQGWGGVQDQRVTEKTNYVFLGRRPQEKAGQEEWEQLGRRRTGLGRGWYRRRARCR